MVHHGGEHHADKFFIPYLFTDVRSDMKIVRMRWEHINAFTRDYLQALKRRYHRRSYSTRPDNDWESTSARCSVEQLVKYEDEAVADVRKAIKEENPSFKLITYSEVAKCRQSVFTNSQPCYYCSATCAATILRKPSKLKKTRQSSSDFRVRKTIKEETT